MKGRLFNLIDVVLNLIVVDWGGYAYRLIKRAYSRHYNQIFKTEDCRFEIPIRRYDGPENFYIGCQCVFGKESVLSSWSKFNGKAVSPKPVVTIGNNCNFGDWFNLTCLNSITIGNNVLTGRWVTISDNNHGRINYLDMSEITTKRDLHSTGSIVIEDNVWIGDKATILAGVRIGKNAIIGANAVVTKDVPAYGVAVGNPARIIKVIKLEDK